MDDYYAHDALLVLDRHLVLAGPVSDDTQRMGHRLAAVLGLPFIDLDRRIEHRAGASIWRLAHDEGEDGLRRRETLALREALRDQPYGVLALGDGALLERTNRAHVVADGRLVVLDYQQAHVYQRLKTLAEARDGRWHPLETEPLERMEQIQSFVRARTEGFSAAESVAVSSGRFGEVMKALEAKLVS